MKADYKSGLNYLLQTKKPGIRLGETDSSGYHLVERSNLETYTALGKYDGLITYQLNEVVSHFPEGEEARINCSRLTLSGAENADNFLLHYTQREKVQLESQIRYVHNSYPLFITKNDDEEEQAKTREFWEARDYPFFFATSVYGMRPPREIRNSQESATPSEDENVQPDFCVNGDAIDEYMKFLRDEIKNIITSSSSAVDGEATDRMDTIALVYKTLHISEFMIVWRARHIDSTLHVMQQLCENKGFTGFIRTVCALPFERVVPEDGDITKDPNTSEFCFEHLAKKLQLDSLLDARRQNEKRPYDPASLGFMNIGAIGMSIANIQGLVDKESPFMCLAKVNSRLRDGFIYKENEKRVAGLGDDEILLKCKQQAKTEMLEAIVGMPPPKSDDGKTTEEQDEDEQKHKYFTLGDEFFIYSAGETFEAVLFVLIYILQLARARNEFASAAFQIQTQIGVNLSINPNKSTGDTEWEKTIKAVDEKYGLSTTDLNIEKICKKLHESATILQKNILLQAQDWFDLFVGQIDQLLALSRSCVGDGVCFLHYEALAILCEWLEYVLKDNAKHRTEKLLLQYHKQIIDILQVYIARLAEHAARSDALVDSSVLVDPPIDNVCVDVVEYYTALFQLFADLYNKDNADAENCKVSHLLIPHLRSTISILEYLSLSPYKSSCLLILDVPIAKLAYPMTMFATLAHEAAHHFGKRLRKDRFVALLDGLGALIFQELGLKKGRKLLNEDVMSALNDYEEITEEGTWFVLDYFFGNIMCALEPLLNNPKSLLKKYGRWYQRLLPLLSFSKMNVMIAKCRTSLEYTLSYYHEFYKECYADIRMIHVLELSPEEYLLTFEAEFPKMFGDVSKKQDNKIGHFTRIRLVMEVCYSYGLWGKRNKDGLMLKKDKFGHKYSNLLRSDGWAEGDKPYGTLNGYINDVLPKWRYEPNGNGEGDSRISRTNAYAKEERWKELRNFLTAEDRANNLLPNYLEDPLVQYLGKCFELFVENEGAKCASIEHIRREYANMVYRDGMYETTFHDVIWEYRKGLIRRFTDEYSWN